MSEWSFYEWPCLKECGLDQYFFHRCARVCTEQTLCAQIFAELYTFTIPYSGVENVHQSYPAGSKKNLTYIRHAFWRIVRTLFVIMYVSFRLSFVVIVILLNVYLISYVNYLIIIRSKLTNSWLLLLMPHLLGWSNRVVTISHPKIDDSQTHNFVPIFQYFEIFYFRPDLEIFCWEISLT